MLSFASLFLDQILRANNLSPPVIPQYPPPPTLLSFWPSPPSVKAACHWPISLSKLTGQKSRATSILTYLSLHTFSLLFFVPSNSSKLLSKVSLLCRCPLFLKSDHNHICDLTYVDSKHQLALFLSLVAHTPVLPRCPKGHHPIFSVQGRKRLSAKCLRVG